MTDKIERKGERNSIKRIRLNIELECCQGAF